MSDLAKKLPSKRTLLVLAVVLLSTAAIGWIYSSWIETSRAQAKPLKLKPGATKDRFDILKGKYDAELEEYKARVNTIGTVATIVGGIFLYYNFRIAVRNTELTESRLITERFGKSIEQIGDEKIEVRLGGIYALERIAKDSPRDHWTLMEVLTSFVQERAPLRKVQKNELILEKPSLNEQKQGAHSDQDSSIPRDVQAALTVIGRREANNDGNRGVLDLSRTNLSGAYLTRADLHRANVTKTNLSGAYLIKADLHRANAIETNLNGAYLMETNLCESILLKADLSGATLGKAKLTSASLLGAKLYRAYLGEANLSGADLRKADLRNANLGGAIFHKTNLNGANLSGANLSGANLREADFSDANLSEANLREADFSGANLSEANLKEADLRGANLSGANLSNADLSRAKNFSREHYKQAKLRNTIVPEDIV